MLRQENIRIRSEFEEFTVSDNVLAKIELILTKKLNSIIITFRYLIP
jgi:hypothetical protein